MLLCFFVIVPKNYSDIEESTKSVFQGGRRIVYFFYANARSFVTITIVHPKRSHKYEKQDNKYI